MNQDEDDKDDPLREDMDPPEEGDESLMECPHCGREMYEGAEQCPRCGRYISAEEEKPTSDGWRWLIIGLIVALCVAVLWSFR